MAPSGMYTTAPTARGGEVTQVGSRGGEVTPHPAGGSEVTSSKARGGEVTSAVAYRKQHPLPPTTTKPRWQVQRKAPTAAKTHGTPQSCKGVQREAPIVALRSCKGVQRRAPTANGAQLQRCTKQGPHCRKAAKKYNGKLPLLSRRQAAKVYKARPPWPQS